MARDDPIPVVPNSAALIERAAALVPVLRANAAEGERLRRLPPGNVQALEDAGIFAMTRPKRFGGYETDRETVGQVMALVASGCPSTAWVLHVYNGVAALMRPFDERALTEAYSGPEPRIAGVFGRVGGQARRVDGGFLVERGTWPFNSGCLNATWDLLRITVREEDGASWVGQALVPMADLTIHDDWDVSGACATGSNTVTCDQLFIPEHRLCAAQRLDSDGIPQDIALTGASLPLGMARYALEHFLATMHSRSLSGLGYDSLGQMPAVQHAVAKAALNISQIENYIDATALAIGRGDGRLSEDKAALVKLGRSNCYLLARQAIEWLYEISPTGDVRRDEPIQRLLRDVRVFELQGQISPFRNRELYGRYLCTPRRPDDTPALS